MSSDMRDTATVLDNRDNTNYPWNVSYHPSILSVCPVSVQQITLSPVHQSAD